MSRLEAIKQDLVNAITEENGVLHSMADDLKQATVRGKALDKVVT